MGECERREERSHGALLRPPRMDAHRADGMARAAQEASLRVERSACAGVPELAEA